MGQLWQMFDGPRGESLRKWAEEVPHDGVIRYLDVFNAERIAVLSQEALSDVLVTRNDDFIKPPSLIKRLGRILGIGLFLAEGEEHKVSSWSVFPTIKLC